MIISGGDEQGRRGALGGSGPAALEFTAAAVQERELPLPHSA